MLVIPIFCYLAHASLVWVFVVYFALLPLCIHGNSCPNLVKWTLPSHTCWWLIHWKVQTSTSVFCCSKESQDSSVMSFLIFFSEDPQVRSTHLWLVWWWWWHCNIVKCACVYDFSLRHCWLLFFMVFWTILIHHSLKASRRDELLWMLTAYWLISFHFCECFQAN